MLHKLGYEYRCEDCLGHFKEEDMAPYQAPVCKECFEQYGPETEMYYQHLYDEGISI